MARTKKAVPKLQLQPNEILVNVLGVDVIIHKNSNVYKVNGKTKYLRQMVWNDVTKEVIKEIEIELLK